MRWTWIFVGLGLVLQTLTVPAAAQDGMAMQRCVSGCLANASGANDPQYRACVRRKCDDTTTIRLAQRQTEGNRQNRQQYDRETVLTVQRQLTELGYDPGPIDGAYGNRTANAIAEFLEDSGLPASDGIDDALVAELQDALNPPAEPDTAGTPGDPAEDPASASAEPVDSYDESPMGARALIAEIYTLPDPDGGIWERDRRPWYFTVKLLDLVDAAERGYKRRHQLDELDFNPVVPGQDYKLSDLKIGDPQRDGDHVRVAVAFTNTLGDEIKKHELVYSLTREDDAWMIDEIVTDGEPLTKQLTEYGKL